MTKINPEAPQKIDAYISDAPEFAQPILTKLREIIHKADSKIVEDWKWGPNFNREGMVCGFGAFKHHVGFVFFQGVLLNDSAKTLDKDSKNVKTRSIRITKPEEINEQVLKEYIQEAVANNLSGKKVKIAPVTVATPDEVKSLLERYPNAEKTFTRLAKSYQKEYINWIISAKREATKEKRKELMIEKLNAGESLNEKYKNC